MRAVWIAVLLGACSDEPRVKDNAHNVLSATVKWRTDQPGSSWVRFGHGDRRWQLGSDVLTDRHEVVVYGLRPRTTYDLELVSVTRGGRERVRTARYRTGDPPSLVRNFDVDVHEPGATDGWTLLNLQHPDEASVAAFYDMEGYPVWYHEIRGDGDVIDASFTRRGTVLMGGTVPDGKRPLEVTLEGEVLWEGRRQVAQGRDGHQHHHMDRLDDGNILGLEKEVRDGVVGDIIYEETAAGDRVWQVSVFDWFKPPERKGDWTHANWAHTDGTHGWVSLAAVSKVVKFDTRTGEIVWILGRKGTLELVGDDRWFTFQHAPLVLPDDHIVVYDNRGAGDHTRVVEYAIDEAAGTATLVWDYHGDEDPRYPNTFYAKYMGSALWLDSGNMIVAGGGYRDDPFVFEIDAEGQLLWRMYADRLYRARRVPTPLTPLEPAD